MASIGCFIVDTQIRADIEDVMRTLADINIFDGKQFTVRDAYQHFTDNKIEVDLESVASIYEDIFDLNDGNYSTKAEVYRAAGKSFSDTLDNLIMMQPIVSQEKTGVLSPGKYVAKSIAAMFRNAQVTDISTQSTMKLFQDMMKKAAGRLVDKSGLPPAQKTAAKTFEQILSQAFDLDQQGYQTLNGSLNSAGQVWNEFMTEVKRYESELAKSKASAATKAQFNLFANAFVNKGYDLLISKKESNEVIKGALIEAGYFREVTKNGVTSKILDWKKLTDAAGSMTYLQNNVSQVLTGKGYGPADIARINSALEKEYVALRASINEKRAKTLDTRNKISSSQQKSTAKKLAELYTYGLFDATPNTYEQVLNSAIGMSDLNQQTFDQLKVFGKALETLFSTKLNDKQLSEAMLSSAANIINEKIAAIIRINQNDNSLGLKVARTIVSIVDASLRFVLTGLHNLLQNNLSNKEAQMTAVIQTELKGELTPALKAANRKLMKAVAKEMIYEGGLHYGELNTTLVNRGRVDDLVNGFSNNKIWHAVAGFFIGRTGLDAMDSKYKASLTKMYLIHNMLKVLTSDTNKNKLTQEAAIKFLSEGLTGKKYEEAEVIAKNVITKINADAGIDILNPSPAFVTRLANDIVKAQLMSGGTVTEEQIMAADSAAYRAAGRDLGHVPNNPLSLGIGFTNGAIQRQMNDALKRKQYPSAMMYTMMQMAFRSFANPFVGGASNWIVLKAEKGGLGLVTGMANTIFKTEAVDVSTTAGMRDLQTNLYRNQIANNKLFRGGTGAATSLILTGVIWAGLKAAFPGDDEEKRRKRMADWRKANRWVSKYTDEFQPEWWLAALYASEGELQTKYVDNYMNWNDQFSSIGLFKKGNALAAKGDHSEAWGKYGEAVGNKFNAPVPYRTIRDIVELSQGFASLVPGSGISRHVPVYTKPRSFMQGFLERGFLEIAHIFKSNPAWTLDALPGVSGATVDQLKRAGIENMHQLKQHQGELQNLHSTDKNGKNVLIFNKNERPVVDEILKTVK